MPFSAYSLMTAALLVLAIESAYAIYHLSVIAW
jgi:hypothetical protein